MKNNFDRSSSGVNLMLSVFFDGDQSRYEFKNNYAQIDNRWSDKYFYTHWGEYSIERFYKVTNKELFKKEFSQDNYAPEDSEDLDELIYSYDLDADYPWVSERYPHFVIRWYSQWDYAEIYYNPDCFWTFFTEERLKESAHHLFWDAPLYCVLHIDDEEFCFHEHLNDLYVYDTDEIIKIANDKIVHDQKEYIVKWLSENLPTSPEYS